MTPTTTRINTLLKRAGLTQRLIRGRGYYYVTGVAVSSGLYVCWLGTTERDFRMAKEHVNEVLANEGIKVTI